MLLWIQRVCKKLFTGVYNLLVMSLKIAIAIRGGVSKKIGRQFGLFEQSLTPISKYIDIVPCANSFQRHILQPNCHHHIDIYLHSWTFEMQDKLIEMYKPSFYEFEKNALYSEKISEILKVSSRNRFKNNPIKIIRDVFKGKNYNRQRFSEDFSGISQALAIERVLSLIFENESKRNPYDAIFIYRPDLILLKDIKFSDYRQDQITCNFMDGEKGDFHFFVPRMYAFEFSKLISSPFLGNFHEVHHWIGRYVRDYMNVSYGADSVMAGHDQEVLRKVKSTELHFDQLQELGMTWEEWQSIE